MKNMLYSKLKILVYCYIYLLIVHFSLALNCPDYVFLLCASKKEKKHLKACYRIHIIYYHQMLPSLNPSKYKYKKYQVRCAKVVFSVILYP